MIRTLVESLNPFSAHMAMDRFQKNREGLSRHLPKLAEKPLPWPAIMNPVYFFVDAFKILPLAGAIESALAMNFSDALVRFAAVYVVTLVQNLILQNCIQSEVVTSPLQSPDQPDC